MEKRRDEVGLDWKSSVRCLNKIIWSEPTYLKCELGLGWRVSKVFDE